MSQTARPGVATGKSDVARLDPIWDALRGEADAAIEADPAMAAFLFGNIVSQPTLEAAVAHRIAQRLHRREMTADMIGRAFADMQEEQKAANDSDAWGTVMRADVVAVYDRDPACTRFIEPVLYFKGFHAIQTHRLAHWAWNRGRKDFALYLQAQSSRVFQTDINPQAKFGRGIFMDHATGIVIGATATLGDDVSILQGVTLGGTGKETGDRHPKVGSGVLLGANATVLGNIEIGHCSRIAAGSMVLKAVPPNVTVAGVPARVVGVAGCAEPSRTMNQMLAQQPA